MNPQLNQIVAQQRLADLRRGAERDRDARSAGKRASAHSRPGRLSRRLRRRELLAGAS